MGMLFLILCCVFAGTCIGYFINYFQTKDLHEKKVERLQVKIDTRDDKITALERDTSDKTVEFLKLHQDNIELEQKLNESLEIVANRKTIEEYNIYELLDLLSHIKDVVKQDIEHNENVLAGFYEHSSESIIT